jgi:tetratricopeptide (TPR) repeat protein
MILAAQMATPKELLMRYTPAALALSLLVAVTASTSFGAPPAVPLDPRAATLVQHGRASLAAGNIDAAVDAYEAAYAVQPGHTAIVLSLAEAARRQGLPGKALHYYRQVLSAEPNNEYAISGEGAAFVEKGALEKAKLNLARLETLCGKDCAPTKQLAAAILRGPAPRVVTAAEVQTQPVATPN